MTIFSKHGLLSGPEYDKPSSQLKSNIVSMLLFSRCLNGLPGTATILKLTCTDNRVYFGPNYKCQVGPCQTQSVSLGIQSNPPMGTPSGPPVNTNKMGIHLYCIIYRHHLSQEFLTEILPAYSF